MHTKRTSHDKPIELCDLTGCIIHASPTKSIKHHPGAHGEKERSSAEKNRKLAKISMNENLGNRKRPEHTDRSKGSCMDRDANQKKKRRVRVKERAPYLHLHERAPLAGRMLKGGA